MSETTIIWLFGICGGWLLLVSGGLFRLYIICTEVRTILMISSKKAAEILHSPDNHHGLDDLLEKYVSRNYELDYEEWQELLERCESIETDIQCGKQERLLASMVSSVCRQKLRRSWEPLNITEPTR